MGRSCIFELPSNVLVAIWLVASASDAAAIWNSTASNTSLTFRSSTAGSSSNASLLLPSTGSGPDYATACQSAHSSYASASSSWTSDHQTVTPQTQVYGGTEISDVTYYSGASTLCDGHARVTYSPAIPLSSGTITVVEPSASTKVDYMTIFSDYPGPSPTCRIAPSDCDPLWAAYSTSLAAAGPNVSAPLQTPPCANQSAASAYAAASSSIYGCGPCTIFGEGVQLVYFPVPTTVSRDMCAATPSASQTYYNDDAVITAYAGKTFAGNSSNIGSDVAVVDGHTFSSGTAYISINTVWAEDRCSSTFGSPVYDAILAMPSESVLSLRYSQDHFQRLMETDTQTGYPVSYADFQQPIPWSAWNGQNLCQGPYGGWACSIIYEDQYRPQLAIPPGIRGLSPDFDGCQNWYNGLWDPPIALTRGGSVAPATFDLPTPTPSATPANPTVRPTALPDQTEGSSAWDRSGVSTPDPQTATGHGWKPWGAPWTRPFTANGHTYTASASNGQISIGSVTLQANSGAQTNGDGVGMSYGSAGLVYGGTTTVEVQQPQDSITQAPTGSSGRTVVVTVITHTYTVVQSAAGAPVVIGGSQTVTPGGAAFTTDDGQVFSAVSNGVAIGWSATLGNDNEPAGVAWQTIAGNSAVVILDGTAQTIAATSPGGPIAVGSQTLTVGGSAISHSDGQVLSAASSGLVIGGQSTGQAQATYLTYSISAVVTIDGNVATVIQSSAGAPVIIGSRTISADSTTTLPNGEVLVAASTGVVVQQTGSGSPSTLASQGASSASASQPITSTKSSSTASAANAATSATQSGSAILRQVPGPLLVYWAVISGIMGMYML